MSSEPVKAPESIESGTSLAQDAWLRLKKNKMSMFSFYLLIIILLACLFGPYLTGHSEIDTDLNLGATPPNGTNLTGTDQLGRDQLTRTLLGGRITLLVGFIATAVSITIGISYGAIAGYLGGRTDNLMMRFVDILYALPFTIFVILLMTLFERSLWLLFASIGAIEWLTMSRIVRGQVMGLKNQEFVEAARSLGLGNRRILFRHILPNTLGPIIVYTTLTIPRVILLESFLSFLGLGVQAPMSSWGTLIKDGADKMDIYPWLLIYPSIIFTATLFAFNFLGDGLRDALDPKASKD